MKTYTKAEVVKMVRKAYQDAADALRPWVADGPHVAIERRAAVALARLEKQG